MSRERGLVAALALLGVLFAVTLFGAQSFAADARDVTITLQAQDNLSGVAMMQIAEDPNSAPAPVPYQSVSTFHTAASTLWVRIQDRAGNWSNWVQISVGGSPYVATTSAPSSTPAPQAPAPAPAGGGFGGPPPPPAALPSASPSSSASPTPTVTASPTPTLSLSPTPSPSPTLLPSPTPTPTPTKKATPTPTPTKKATPTPTPTKKATPTPTPTKPTSSKKVETPATKTTAGQSTSKSEPKPTVTKATAKESPIAHPASTAPKTEPSNITCVKSGKTTVIHGVDIRCPSGSTKK